MSPGGTRARAGRELGLWHIDAVRRSVDDHPFDPADLPPGADDASPVSWAVVISDDYDDAEPRVVLTVEELGRPGAGLVAHLGPGQTRRLRIALADALREIGADPGR